MIHCIPTKEKKKKNNQRNSNIISDIYPMSTQSVKKHNVCTLTTAHKKFQHTLAGVEKKRKVPSLAGAE